MSREVLRDALVYLPARVIPALVAMIAVPILTRLLSPEQYGQYLLALSSLMLIATFSVSWLVSVTIRFYILHGVDKLSRTSLPLLVISILFGCVIWVIVSAIIGGDLAGKDYIYIGLLWLVSHSCFEYLSGWLRARNLAKGYSLAMSWRSIVGLAIAVLLLMMDRGSHNGSIVILSTASAMIIALVLLARYALKGEDKGTNADDAVKPELRIILRYGIPAAFISLITIALSVADRYVIQAYLGAESVAVYGASYDLAEKTVFFSNSMLLLSSSVIGFRIFENEGEDRAARFLSQLMRLYLLIAPPLVVALAVMAPNIIKLLLPEKYYEGHTVLSVIALSGLLVGVMHRYSLLLSFHKRTDVIMWCSAGALLSNILACFVLIPILGLYGAAISTAIAYALWLAFIRIAAARYQGPVFPWKTFVRVIASLFVSVGIMTLVFSQAEDVGVWIMILGVALGFLGYAVSLFLFREITNKEYESVIHAFQAKFNKV